MNDEQSPFDELLRSPWEQPPGARRGRGVPWSVVAAIAIGALAVLGGYAVSSGGDPVASAPSTTTTEAVTTASPTTTVVAEAPVAFPEGFVQITDMTGIKPEYMIDTGDQLIISFTTANRRGFTDSAGFDGAVWVLVTESGEELSAAGIVTNVSVSSSFSVEFDKEGNVTPRRLRLIDRWTVESRDRTVELPFSGVPAELSNIDVDLGGDVTLAVDLSLGETDGEATWTLEGAGDNGGSVRLFVTIGSNPQSPSAFYFDNGSSSASSISTGLGDAATTGVESLTRQEGDGSDQDTMSIEATVTLIGRLPADATFELDGLPSVSR